MKIQAIRFPFPWRIIGTIASVGLLAAFLVFVLVFEPAMSFRQLTANTSGRTSRDPKMQPLEDKAFEACVILNEPTCYEAADKLDRSSVMDLKYRLVVAAGFRDSPNSASDSSDDANPASVNVNYHRILAHLDLLIAQKDFSGSSAR